MSRRGLSLASSALLAIPCGLAWLLSSGAASAQSGTLAWLPSLSFPDTVFDLTVHDDGAGGGPALYVAGGFTTGIAALNGTGMLDIGSGVTGFDPDFGDPIVMALASFPAGIGGGGPQLYASGFFTGVDGVAASNIAMWNGATWSALGTGLSGLTQALCSFDDGSGTALYAGGAFKTAGGVPAVAIAKWNGSAWSALGSSTNGTVRAMTVFDDGTGAALYVGGEFTAAGGAPATGIARWDGTHWSALGSGLDIGTMGAGVEALQVFDDGAGGGPALYVSGAFTQAGGAPAHRIARWDGANWTTLGTGMNSYVDALGVFDDGGGPALYAGGGFTVAGDQPCNHVAKWNGSAWSYLGAGIGSGPPGGESVLALQAFDTGDGYGTALWTGGSFLTAGQTAQDCLSRWGHTATPPAWTFLASGLAASKGVPDLAGFGEPGAGHFSNLTLSSTKKNSAALLLIGLSNAPTPFKGGTLLPIPALFALPITTGSSADGEVAVSFSWPAGLPPGFKVYYQCAVKDPAGPQGFGISNALSSTTP